MEHEASGGRVARQTSIEAVKDMLAQKQREVDLIRRDPVKVKVFWDDVRVKLWIDDDEVYAEETEAASQLSEASDVDPFDNDPFGDGRRGSALRHIVRWPLMVVTGSDSSDNEPDSTRSTVKTVTPDSTSECVFDWTTYKDRTCQRSDADLIDENESNTVAIPTVDLFNISSPTNGQQQGQMDEEGHPKGAELSSVEIKSDREKTSTESEAGDVIDAAPKKQTNGTSEKDDATSQDKAGIRRAKLEAKWMWGKIRGMLGAPKSTTW
jgi:hypothetical protein